MTQDTTSSTCLALTLNGSRLAVGTRPDLAELDTALRSVALSDSPVLIRAPAEDYEHILNRLHALSRRSELPLHRCSAPNDAELLFEGIRSRGESREDAEGTWALFEVDDWPDERQEMLGKVLEQLDLGRLHGRLRHERIPRVMMFTDVGRTIRVLPSLDRRISYFTLTAEPTAPKET